MLTPIGEPLHQDLQGRGYHIFETLEGLGMPQQLNLACHTLLAMLLLRRPSPSAPKEERDSLKMICEGVQSWLKNEIGAMRRSQAPSKKTTAK